MCPLRVDVLGHRYGPMFRKKRKEKRKENGHSKSKNVKIILKIWLGLYIILQSCSRNSCHRHDSFFSLNVLSK